MKRSTVLAALAAVPAMTLPRPVRAADTLNVAYVVANDFLPAFVAKDQGIFERRNLDVTLTPTRIISQVPVALSSGALDIGALPPTVLLQAREGGLDLVAVAGCTRMTRKNPIISLIGTSAVKTADDLRGKKVGVPGLFAGLDIVLREWLKSKKVPLSAITFVEVPFPQMQEFLSRGQVDAVAAIEPIRSRILGAGFGAVKIADYFSDVRDDINLVDWATTRAWALAHKDQLSRFRASLVEAMAWMSANPEPARAIEVKYLNFAGPSANYSLSVTRADFQFYAGAMRDLGVLKQPVDFNALMITG
jgi:NitT/TauT family transport system substrate-binding protein